MIEAFELKRKRGQRGPGKKRAMEHVSIRVPSDVMDFYRQATNPSNAMREALMLYADTHR